MDQRLENPEKLAKNKVEENRDEWSQKLENWKIAKVTRRCGVEERRDCVSQSKDASRDAIVKDTR